MLNKAYPELLHTIIAKLDNRNFSHPLHRIKLIPDLNAMVVDSQKRGEITRQQCFTLRAEIAKEQIMLEQQVKN